MNTEHLLQTISGQCDALRDVTSKATQELREYNRRLEQILQQMHKNIPVRDGSFSDDFNGSCVALRKELDHHETIWQEIRAQVRACTAEDWTAELVLPAKGINSRAKTLSRACDEFTTTYDVFIRTYKRFTTEKLNVWLLTACQSDLVTLTGKILFVAREIAKHTENKRGMHVNG